MIRLITSLVAVLTVVSVQSQTTTIKEAPKLVIGITIDQLRGDYLEMFQHTFGERGFKRLLNEGLVYQNIYFDFPNINSAAAIATIYTGTNPFYHGIVGPLKYSSDKNTEVSIYNDDSYIGNYTQDKISPKALKVSTITDELKLATQGYGNVFAFAPNIEEALSSGGHAANSAYWLDNSNGKWATTTYYKDYHVSVDSENRSGKYSGTGQNLHWKPLLGIDQYNAFPYTTNRVAFQHSFENYGLVKKSAIVNENTRNIATSIIQKADLGKDSNPDFLALTFYLGNYPQALDKNYSYEIQDAYARLDRELQQLLDDVDKQIGLRNTLIFIASTGYFEAGDDYPADSKIPEGIFYTNRCEALLNMYLMAIYGKEQWVEKIYNNQVFLNRKLIESKHLNLEEIQNKTAEFVVQFTGVQDAATGIQLLTNKANDNMIRFKNIFSKELSGDVFLEIQPGFKVISEHDKNSDDSSKKRIRQTAIAAPVIFFGNGIKSEKVKRTISATEIAPTVSHILRIRAPNAAKSQILPEFMYK